MIAPELANSIAPPTPCPIRMPISHSAPALPFSQVAASSSENSVKTAKPRLYIRTRPYMSPSRPKLTTSTAVTTGSRGSSTAGSWCCRARAGRCPMPRKMSGQRDQQDRRVDRRQQHADVVFDRTTHL
jgi:hypothetical protein